MIPEIVTRLEFSDQQRCFHFYQPGDHLDDSVYTAIAFNVPDEIANAFTNFIFNKYVNFDGRYTDPDYKYPEGYVHKRDERRYPDLDTVRDEWKWFNVARLLLAGAERETVLGRFAYEQETSDYRNADGL